jgi:hypothetical protein
MAETQPTAAAATNNPSKDSEKDAASDVQDEKHVHSDTPIDFNKYQTERAGRLVIDPEEAKIEFGEAVASKLKLSRDGKKVLWPQPSDDPDDPQNVSRTFYIYLFYLTIISFLAVE